MRECLERGSWKVGVGEEEGGGGGGGGGVCFC